MKVLKKGANSEISVPPSNSLVLTTGYKSKTKKDIQIDSYFLPEIKNKMFWSLNLEQDGLKSYEAMDLKMKSAVLSKKYCNVFEYVLEKDIPGKINEKEGIFFDINKYISKHCI